MYSNEIKRSGVPDAVVIAVLLFVGIGFAVVHAIYRFTTFFQVFFGVLAGLCAVRLCVYYSKVQDPRARSVARSYLFSSLFGVACWMIDYHLCSHVQSLPVNPQGHAW